MDDTLLNRTKCPVKLADMLSVGLPVVAEDVGQVSEYVRHRKTGLLFKSGDEEALANGVITLLSDEVERAILSAAGAEHIRGRFSWAQMAKIATDAYGFELHPS